MIQFRIRFELDNATRDDFVEMIRNVYGPGLARQQGFRSWRLLAPYRDRDAASADDGVVFELQFEFESEEARRSWVASSEHERCWAMAKSLVKSHTANGFDIVGDSE